MKTILSLEIMSVTNSLEEAITTSLQLSAEEGHNLATHPDQLSNLKLSQLKEVIRTLKRNGYNTVDLILTANKRDIINMLVKVAQMEAQAKNDHGDQHPDQTNALSSTTHVVNGSSSENTTVLASIKSADTHHHNQQHKIQNKTQPTKNKSAKHLFPSPSNNLGLSISESSNARLLEVLNSARKVQMYRTLKGVPGISEEEILGELREVADSSHIDEDTILVNIVAKRTVRELGCCVFSMDSFRINQLYLFCRRVLGIAAGLIGATAATTARARSLIRGESRRIGMSTALLWRASWSEMLYR